MKDSNRIIPVVTVLLIAIVATAPIIGLVEGQILTEKTYYEEDFEQYNETAIALAPDDELRNQYLTNTSRWSEYGDGERRGIDINYGENPGDNYRLEAANGIPYLAGDMGNGNNGHRKRARNGRFAMNRTIPVPDGMSNPVLVVEYAAGDNSNSISHTIYVDEKAYTTRNYNDGGINPWYADRSAEKIGWIYAPDNNDGSNWKSIAFPVQQSKDEVDLRQKARLGSGDDGEMAFRNVYWVESPDFTAKEIEGYTSLTEDDSFGGPEPYDLNLIVEQTADGEETSLRSHGSSVQREFNVEGISSKPETAYFEVDITANSKAPVNWRLEQYGQEIASGTIDGSSSAVDTSKVDFEDDEFTLIVESEGQYDIHDVRVVALEETAEGDPLQSEGPVVLNAQQGYDRTVGLFIGLLDITTTTLLYVIMIALIVGAMAFSFTKSFRGQEFGQSMMYGAIIAGVVIVGLVPTMNLATWIFTGDIQRAPLANPSLEAEPPTYYSTDFQAGTMDGWENPVGQARPVQVGEGFNLQVSGQPGMVKKDVHISLGNSLDTGFVRMSAIAQSSPGYTPDPHETTLRVRVYVTDGEAPQRVDPETDVTQDDLSNYEDLVVAQDWARSFDGEVVEEDGTIVFPMDGNTIYVEVIAESNRDDELAVGAIESIAVGATTEGTGEAASEE